MSQWKVAFPVLSFDGRLMGMLKMAGAGAAMAMCMLRGGFKHACGIPPCPPVAALLGVPSRHAPGVLFGGPQKSWLSIERGLPLGLPAGHLRLRGQITAAGFSMAGQTHFNLAMP